mmetsp:Transcript_5907/g.7800  ORF Transcript_5907/g.7800 Transcript_5907/m.7800 type:complete len:128 (-) Transcript_5907:598-981(-)
MTFKKFKPVTPSLRHLKLLNFSKGFKKNLPVKELTFSKKNSSGRNNQGKITVFQRGSGVKQSYRFIDFQRLNTQGIVEKIEYDPNRTGFLGRIFNFKEKTHSYILAPKKLENWRLYSIGCSSFFKEW